MLQEPASVAPEAKAAWCARVACAAGTTAVTADSAARAAVAALPADYCVLHDACYI